MAPTCGPSSRTLGSAYAVRGGTLVHISSVPRGLACGCVCAKCQTTVVARKGQIREHHFAHHNATDCDGGPETILHRLAKETFDTLGSIDLPDYRIRLKHNDINVNEQVLPARTVKIDSVTLELRLGPIVPDIIVNPGPNELLIEIAVTHLVDRKKSRAIRRLSLPTIEIRLQPGDAWRTREQMKTKLTTETACKHWIFHPNQRIHEKLFYAAIRKRKRDNRARLRDPRYLLGTVAPSVRRPFQRRKISSSDDDRWIINRWAEWFKRLNGRSPTVQEIEGFVWRRGRH